MGQLSIGALGTLGLAFETTYPSTTFTAPTVWLPIMSETLERREDVRYRENIRGVPNRQNPIQGYTHIEGDVKFEVTADRLVYICYLARFAPTRPATTSPYTYTFTTANQVKPTTAASGVTASRTACVTVQRGGDYFGYYGVSVTKLSFAIEDAKLVCTASLMGIDEANPGTQTPSSWPTSQPYSAGKNSVIIASQGSTTVARTDVDTISIDIDDKASNEQRVKSGTGPAYIAWHDREISGRFDIDFTDRAADYAAFTGKTTYDLTLKGSNNSTNDEVSIKLGAISLETFPIHLGSMADIVRASCDFHGFYDGTNNDVTITIKTTEAIS